MQRATALPSLASGKIADHGGAWSSLPAITDYESRRELLRIEIRRQAVKRPHELRGFVAVRRFE